MQVVVLGVQLDENDVSVLKKAFVVKDQATNYLTPKKVEGKDAALNKLVKNELILKTIVRKKERYSISDKGKEAYGLLPKDMINLISTKKSKVSKIDEIAELKATIEEMNYKLDKILSLLYGVQSIAGNGNGSYDKSEAFEQSLVYEYNTLNAREFLSDGKVWHEQLKRIMMERHQYRDYEYDELLQQLKQKKLGMISLSQGKDKTWIEIRV